MNRFYQVNDTSYVNPATAYLDQLLKKQDLAIMRLLEHVLVHAFGLTTEQARPRLTRVEWPERPAYHELWLDNNRSAPSGHFVLAIEYQAPTHRIEDAQHTVALAFTYLTALNTPIDESILLQ